MSNRSVLLWSLFAAAAGVSQAFAAPQANNAPVKANPPATQMSPPVSIPMPSLNGDIPNEAPKAAPKPTDAERLQTCRSAHKNLGYGEYFTNEFCSFRSRVERVGMAQFRECMDAVNAEGLGEAYGPFCFYSQLDPKDGATKQATREKLTACMVSASYHVAPPFWREEDINSKLAARQSAAPVIQFFSQLSGLPLSVPFFMKRFHDDCLGLTPAPMAPLFGGGSRAKSLRPESLGRVHGEVLYHTYSSYSLGKEIVRFGGLSGLTFRDNELIAVTDDKAHPALLHLGVEVRQDDAITLRFRRVTDLAFMKDISDDLEDVSALSDGRLIVSSENTTLSYGANNNSLLLEIDSSLKSARPLQAPGALYSRTHEEKIDCPQAAPAPADDVEQAPAAPAPAPGPKSIFDWGITRVSGGTPLPPKPTAAPAPPPPEDKVCYRSVVTGGIQFNKGLEAMTVDNASRKLYFAPEQQLEGHRWDLTIPLYEKSLDSLDQAEEYTIYKYDLDNRMDNGLVALTPWAENKLLALERGFDPVVREAIVNLYLVRLDPAKKTLKKTLLTAFKDLRSQLTPGFRTIENFEGMVVGPTLSTGEKVLMLVSDNNFRADQKTTFLMLALDPAKVEAKK